MSKGRILAVDDEHFFRVLYEDLLGGEGYGVTTAEDGAEAMEILEAQPFDLVILDVIMPGEDGVRVAERIKDAWPAIEILFVTSLRDVKVATNAMQRGASDFLTKPINSDELLAVVMRLFERRAVVQEHTRLLDENVYFLDALGVYQRGLSILEQLNPTDLCDAILERLMAETSAQGGVIWLSREEDRNRFRLQRVRGLVVPEEEVREFTLGDHPHADPLRSGRPFYAEEKREGEDRDEELRCRNTLYVPALEDGAPVILVRLTDKVGGNQFSDEDLRKARLLEKLFVTALRNARTYNRMSRRSLKDEHTQAFEMDVFESHVSAELAKSKRYERKFSVVGLRIANYDDLANSYDAKTLRECADSVITSVAACVREIDFIGRLREDEFYVLLPETDYFASLSLKKRMGKALAGSRRGPVPLRVAQAAVTYPGDGDSTRLLFHNLKSTLLREQRGLDPSRNLSAESHWEFVDRLLDSGLPADQEEANAGNGTGNTVIQKGSFPETYFTRLVESLLEEIEREPGMNGIAYVSQADPDAGQALFAPRNGIEKPATTLYAIGPAPAIDEDADPPSGGWATFVPVFDDRITDHRFILFISEEAAYAFYGRRNGEGLEGFHTSDKAFVESLIFQLQEEYDLQSHL